MMMYYFTEIMDFVSIKANLTTITAKWIALNDSDCVPLLTYYFAIFEKDGDLLMSTNTSSNQHTFVSLMASTEYTIVTLAAIGSTNGSNSTIRVATDFLITTRQRPTTDPPSMCHHRLKMLHTISLIFIKMSSCLYST